MCKYIYNVLCSTLRSICIYYTHIVCTYMHMYIYSKYLFVLGSQFEGGLKPVAVVGDLSANSQWKLGQQM